MSSNSPKPIRSSWLSAIAPGILVAATGVGAGDLLTASLGGSAVGLGLLWAAWVGAIVKWFLNEGLARWQMATGTTLLEGWVTKLGRWVQWVFLGYLLVWSVFTGGALVNACGVAGTGLFQLGDDPRTSKIIWGITHSAVGLALVLVGGFKLFERLMAACIAMMFVTVVLTAVLIQPDWSAVGRGLITPTIPPEGLGWVLGVLGGVGGTVTLLSYGYWIRERQRAGQTGVRACRWDLGIGYTMTALFGVAMIIIGSRTVLAGKGATLAIELSSQLGGAIGPAGKWIFLCGFWGAVFSSLLGVWQGVPYLFADFMRLRRSSDPNARTDVALTGTRAYRVYLVAIAVIPIPLLWGSVDWAQKTYAVLGSLFMPLLALTLLVMNNRRGWVGRPFRNGWLANVMLTATLAFFLFVAGRAVGSAFHALTK